MHKLRGEGRTMLDNRAEKRKRRAKKARTLYPADERVAIVSADSLLPIAVLNPKALSYGVLVFALLYAAHVVIIPIAAKAFSDTEPFSALWIMNQVLGFATVGVSGFVAGRIAGERQFAHGALVGAIGTLASAVAAAVMAFFTSQKLPTLLGLILWMITNGLLCGIGAVLSERAHRKPTSGPNGPFTA